MIHVSYDTITLEQYETYFINQFGTEETIMTDNKSIKDMYEELIINYDEGYHEYTDIYNPEGYIEYLDGLTEDELIELYNETFN